MRRISVRLAWDTKGNLIAGSDGSGLVYRIDPHGNGYVLFEAPRREITSLAIGKNGTIYAACVGDKSHNPLPPLPVQGLRPSPSPLCSRNRCRRPMPVHRCPRVRKFTHWPRARRHASYGPARMTSSMQWPRVRWLDRHQRESRAHFPHPRRWQLCRYRPFAGATRPQPGCSPGLRRDSTSAPATPAESTCWAPSQTHEYASDVLDAGAFARFGRVEIEPGSSGYEILTRTGNVEQPVRGWSDWQAVRMVPWFRHRGVFCSGKLCCTPMEHWAALASITCPSIRRPLSTTLSWFPARASITGIGFPKSDGQHRLSHKPEFWRHLRLQLNLCAASHQGPHRPSPFAGLHTMTTATS